MSENRESFLETQYFCLVYIFINRFEDWFEFKIEILMRAKGVSVGNEALIGFSNLEN